MEDTEIFEEGKELLEKPPKVEKVNLTQIDNCKTDNLVDSIMEQILKIK